MAATYSYDRLPTVQESDIADANDNAYDAHSILRSLDSEVTLRPLSFAAPSSDRGSLQSFNTYGSSISSGSGNSSLEKLKSLGNRIRRKPLPQQLKGSVRQHPVADIEPTRVGRGVWTDQLLVDRSLRTMAVTMSIFAIAMIVLVTTYSQRFRDRANPNSTSVGGDTRSCKEVTRTNTALLLLINVCATMILGMSNTYQQLVTSLKVSDLKYVLSKFGDSRVGTNSPFSINHKQDGKKRAWSAWLLLILTSMPVHFLANSLIGPSFIQVLPQVVEFDERVNLTDYNYASSRPAGLYSYSEELTGSMSFPCWSAFRTGTPHLSKTRAVAASPMPATLLTVLGLLASPDPQSLFAFSSDSGTFSSSQDSFDAAWKRMRVHYDSGNCTQHMGTATDITALESNYRSDKYWNHAYAEGDCIMGSNVFCTLRDSEPAQCRLNVRMSAAFILLSCLVVKAIYMCAVNLIARGRTKTHCLTFGDVIVASASHSELRVQGECMVNAGDNYRRHNSHTCHKHCKNPEESKTGDEIGHCQKCKKWNSTDKFSNQSQPTIATKIKKSLISNLGTTALTQMCLLMFCSMALFGVSIATAVPLGVRNEYLKEECMKYNSSAPRNGISEECKYPANERFEVLSGGFGGFNRSLTLASLSPDALSNEFLSFSISNGAQFIYSLLYLMMIYNITLVSQEWDWGKLEHTRKRIRCTIVAGESFSQNYLLQLPKKILLPIMAYSVLTHWMLGEALQTQEVIWLESSKGRHIEHSKYNITFAAYPLWIATFLILLMTSVCWWAYTYTREGFMPQMYGSIRTLCAATTSLDDFPSNGLQWGDLGHGRQFRHAGLSAEEVMKIVPNELYAGLEKGTETKKTD